MIRLELTVMILSWKMISIHLDTRNGIILESVTVAVKIS
jgi:hypothetical protein